MTDKNSGTKGRIGFFIPLAPALRVEGQGEGVLSDSSRAAQQFLLLI